MFKRISDEQMVQIRKSVPYKDNSLYGLNVQELSIQAQLKADMKEVIDWLKQNENIDRGLDTCYIIYPSQLHELKKQLEEME
jgi:hypothetical protein